MQGPTGHVHDRNDLLDKRDEAKVDRWLRREERRE